MTEDSLALDPWISWPTMGRYVPDNKHQILHLGQVLDEVDTQYPPIWMSESFLTGGGRILAPNQSLEPVFDRSEV